MADGEKKRGWRPDKVDMLLIGIVVTTLAGWVTAMLGLFVLDSTKAVHAGVITTMAAAVAWIAFMVPVLWNGELPRRKKRGGCGETA